MGSVCPNAGLNPWAAAMGHPWPSAANPASCRVTHGFKPAFGQRG
ncbi:Threonine synthase [Pseudomonas orientalis]|nr:Threonine synthase [Pseudomonas orientalis]